MARVSDRARIAVEVGVIMAVAAIVEFVPGGSDSARGFEAALLAALAAGIGYLGLRLYREHRVAAYSLGDARRALLYGAIALGVFVLSAKSRLWQSSLGELAWFLMLAGVALALVGLLRFARRY